MKSLAYQLFLPTKGVDTPCPDARWRVVYRRGMITTPVEVCAPDEETAVMRAGMKRAALFANEEWFFTRQLPGKFVRESVERLS